MQRDEGDLDDNRALLALTALLLMLLAACGPSKELLFYRGLVAQCEQIVDMCVNERKTAELRRGACEQTASQLIKCLDKGAKK